MPMEKNTIPQSEAIALYNVYRDYVKHEDTLMNVRMTWFLTTQAFLFSCYALLNQKRLSAGTFELGQILAGDHRRPHRPEVQIRHPHPDADLLLRIFYRAPFLHFREGGVSRRCCFKKQVGCGTRPEWRVCKSAKYNRRGRRKGQGRGVGFSRIPAESRHGDMGLDRDYALLFAPRLSKLRRSGPTDRRPPSSRKGEALSGIVTRWSACLYADLRLALLPVPG